MRSQVQRSPARPAPAPERRFIPSLPTLDPMLFAPTLEPPRAPRFPLARLGEPDAQLFYLARAGIHHVISHWLGGAPGTVLMPAYHHGVEVEAVRAAGAKVAFYRVDARMRIDLEDLATRALLPDVKVVYVTHYAGFAQPLNAVAHLCHELDLKLFEDCALSLFARDPHGRPLGSTGDASVFCLYKMLPVPHGGLLLAPGVPLPASRPGRPPLASTLHHAAGLMLAELELQGGALGRTLRSLARSAAHSTVDRVVETVKTGTQHLHPGDLTFGASKLVELLLPRFDAEMVIVRRRRNFRRLADALRGHVQIYGDPLPLGACPLFLPVRVDDKPRIVKALHALGIDAIDFWSDHDPRCDLAEFPEVAALRRQVLELPCHQSLDDDAIDFVAQAVKRVLEHA